MTMLGRSDEGERGSRCRSASPPVQTLSVQPGLTVAELLALAVPDRALHRSASIALRSYGEACAKPIVLHRNVWHIVRPKPGMCVEITIANGGGFAPDWLSSTLRAALVAVSVTVVAAFVGVSGEGDGSFLQPTVTEGRRLAAVTLLIPCTAPLMIRIEDDRGGINVQSPGWLCELIARKGAGA